VAKPREEPQDHELLIAIVVLLLAGLTFEEFSRRLTLLLAPLGIPAAATLGLLTLLGPGGLAVPAPSRPGGALAMMERGMVARRAMYLLAGARRMAGEITPAAERALYGAHLRAEKRRLDAARRIDAAAARWGPVLGWVSRRDERTTAECKTAHGGNFSALRPPTIGWPGTLHAGNCRCLPGPPWSEAAMLS
jgi:hypothetical protein